mmetsp:Transcript_22612/g.40702  ORF Transcript_22612/g.40702 Transcript_22612/m.40702 type:complete len:160 (-) Transcript_22612:1057-1536(-)
MSEPLKGALKQKIPDLDAIASAVLADPLLLRCHDYLTGGSPLHFAVKYDTKYCRKGAVTQLLLDLGADPNHATTAGSLPLYWGIPHLSSMDWTAINLILACPLFDMHKPHANRGSAWAVMESESLEDPLTGSLFDQLQSSRRGGKLALLFSHCKLRHLE